MNAAKSDLVPGSKASNSSRDRCPDPRLGNRSQNEALARELTSLAGHINAATLIVQKTNKAVSCDACASSWSGEALDYDMAVSALLAMEEVEQSVEGTL